MRDSPQNKDLNSIYTEEEKLSINKNAIIKHVAIIMDGNRRWAEQHNQASSFGHKQGVNTLEVILASCIELGIQNLTVFAFSTENKNRSLEEVEFLMSIFFEYIENNLEDLFNKGIKLLIIGDRNSLPEYLQSSIEKAEKKTAENTLLNFVVALNYGGRNDILRSYKQVYQDYQHGILDINNLTEEDISRRLDTKDIPDPDLVIRTSGEQRISNFLLWQMAYSELFFIDKLWPDFNHKDLLLAVRDFSFRKIRKGN